MKNSQEQKDIVSLESKEELLSFLEISIDSTLVMLKVKHDSSSSSPEKCDCYLIGLNLPVISLEQISKPFTFTFPI